MAGVRGIKFTKQERDYVLERIDGRQDPPTPSELKIARSVERKVKAVETPLVKGPSVNAPAIEEQLILYSRGKVIPLAEPNWARYCHQAAGVNANVGDAQTVGTWIAEQGWLKGPITLDSVLKNWSSWLAKARLWAAPLVRAAAGLGANGAANVGQNPTSASPAAPQGRPAPGLRRNHP